MRFLQITYRICTNVSLFSRSVLVNILVNPGVVQKGIQSEQTVLIFVLKKMTVVSTLGKSAAVIGGLNLAGFALTAATGTHRITDLTGTAAFALSALATYGKKGTIVSKLLTGAVVLWAGRLGGYLFGRIMTIDKDERLNKFFRKTRDEPWFTGPSNFPLKLAGFWTIQALWGFVVLLPVTLTHALISKNASAAKQLLERSPLRKAGVAIGLTGFTIGFLVESIADLQKFRFKLDQKKNKDGQKWIDQGLWAYSRHPSYFGELCTWWSLSLTGASACLSSSLLPISVVSRIAIVLFSPAFLTTLIMFVSGVNLLEEKDDKRYKDDPEYQAYKKRTNALIPKLF
jgi:steroid 5-alpha reductase family enzyme